MSIWNRIFANAGRFFGASGSEKSECKDLTIANIDLDMDFTASVVALAAKMAKADGVTTIEESQAFQAAFPIHEGDRKTLDKLFALAGGSVLGYEGYAKKISRKYQGNRILMMDILAILFLVAAADGTIKQVEKEFLTSVSKHLGITESDFSRVSGLFIKNEEQNPYVILGVHESDDDKTVKAAWLKIVTENHPDNFLARKEPSEFVKAANELTARANDAYSKIRQLRNNSEVNP